MGMPNSQIAHLAGRLDAWLLRRGFSTKTLRAVALYEIAGCLVLFSASFILLAIPGARAAGLWLFWFSLGAAAGAVNYIILVISGQRLIKSALSGEPGGRRSTLADVSGIMLKLLITGILFCAAAAVFRASIVALLAGFTLPLAVMLAVGLIYARQERN